MKHRILTLLALLMSCGVAQAGYVFVKLVDEREQPVANARFFLKLPMHDSYEPFGSRGSQGGNGSMQRHQAGWIFNYSLGLGSSAPVWDVKVVAPGYRVHTWTQVWPRGGDEDYLVISLEPEGRRHGQRTEPSQESLWLQGYRFGLRFRSEDQAARAQQELEQRGGVCPAGMRWQGSTQPSAPRWTIFCHRNDAAVASRLIREVAMFRNFQLDIGENESPGTITLWVDGWDGEGRG